MTRRNSHSAAHLSNQDLIRLMDAELPANEAARASEHLQHCWHCRHRAERLAATVHNFVSACDSIWNGLSDYDGGRGSRQRLHQELRRQAAEPGNRPVISRYAIWRKDCFSWISQPQVATSLLAVLLIACWTFFGGAAPRAEAAELLRRASDAESKRLLSAAHMPLLHQTLEVRRGTARAEWEIWHAPGRGRFRESWRGDSSLIAGLKEVYLTHGTSPRSPISARNFDVLRLSLAGRRESVTTRAEDGTVSIQVDAAPGTPRITRAALTLRSSDLHPLAQSLDVVEADGVTRHRYDLRELGSEVRPYEQAPAGLFEEAPARTARESTPAPRLLPTVAEPDQLEESEARLREALHISGLQALLAPRIKIESNAVMMHVIVEDERQRQRVEAAVRDIPFLNVQIWVPDELPESGPASRVEQQAERLERTEPALAGELKARFGSVEQSNQYLSRVEQALRRSLASGLALRQLAERYSPEKFAKLPREAAAAVQRMAASHGEALGSDWREVDGLLDPLLRQSDARGPASECPFALESSHNAVEALRELESAIQRLYVPRLGKPAAADAPTLLEQARSARAELNRLSAAPCSI